MLDAEPKGRSPQLAHVNIQFIANGFSTELSTRIGATRKYDEPWATAEYLTPTILAGLATLAFGLKRTTRS